MSIEPTRGDLQTKLLRGGDSLTELSHLPRFPRETVLGKPGPEQPYEDGVGVRLVSMGPSEPGHCDVVRVVDDLFLILSNRLNMNEGKKNFLGDGWLVAELRLEGESISLTEELGRRVLKPRECHIASYPVGLNEAVFFKSNTMVRNIALVSKPNAYLERIGISEKKLPLAMRKLFAAEQNRFRCGSVAITPELIHAARDLLFCSFRGPLRRTYMEAKTVELECLVMDSLLAQDSRFAAGVALSQSEIESLGELRSYLDNHYSDPPSLPQMVRMLGINRNKLSYGFKQCFGVTIFSYCNERRMDAAHELLKDLSLSIAQVSAKVGYVHPTNFTIAFKRHFGFLPKDINHRNGQEPFAHTEEL